MGRPMTSTSHHCCDPCSQGGLLVPNDKLTKTGGEGQQQGMTTTTTSTPTTTKDNDKGTHSLLIGPLQVRQAHDDAGCISTLAPTTTRGVRQKGPRDVDVSWAVSFLLLLSFRFLCYPTRCHTCKQLLVGWILLCATPALTMMNHVIVVISSCTRRSLQLWVFSGAGAVGG
jgi:hypothetical protein